MANSMIFPFRFQWLNFRLVLGAIFFLTALFPGSLFSDSSKAVLLPTNPSIASSDFSNDVSAGLMASPGSFSDEVSSTISSIDAVDKQLAGLVEEKGLSPETRMKLEEMWGKVRGNISLTAEWNAKTEEFGSRAEKAPRLLEEIKAQLALPDPELASDSLATFTATLIAQVVSTREAELKSSRDQFLELESRIVSMTKRRLELPNLLAEAKSRLQGLNDENQPAKQSDESLFGQKALAAFEKTQIRLFEAEAKAYERQLETYETRLELAKSQRELALRRANNAEERLKKLRLISNEIKKREADEANQKARQELQEFARSLPAIAAMAQENAEFAAKRSEMVSITEGATKEFDESGKKMAKLIEDRKSLEEKVKGLGLSDYLGLLFRVKRTELPNPAMYRERIQRRKTLITRIQGQLLSLEEKAAEMVDLKRLHKVMMESMNGQITPDRRSAIELSLQDLLKSRRELVDNLVKDFHFLFVKLADLDSLERRLLNTIRQFEGFINKHIFWIPSCQAFSLQDFPDAIHGLSIALEPGKWRPVVSSSTRAIVSNPWPFIAAVFILLLLLWGHRWAITYNRKLAEQVANPSTDSFFLTVESLLLTLYMTSFIPALIGFAYLLTSWGEGPVGIGKYLEEGLWAILPLTWALLFIRGVFREKGLANVHFQWHLESAHSLLRSRLLWLTAIGIPLYLAADVVLYHGNERVQESMGRLLFLATSMMTAFLLQPVLAPTGTVFTAIHKFFANKFVYRARHVLYFLGVVFPIVLCVLAMLGYLFTAQQLFLRNVQTLLMLFGGVFGYGFITRTLQLQRRKLAFQLRQLKAARNLSKKLPETAFHEGEELPLITQDGSSIHSMSVQANNLIFGFFVIVLAVGLWSIWRDVLPAARILDQFQLWNTDLLVTETITKADGTTASQVIDRVVAITLLDLLGALSVFILTLVAARNIPGFLEFAILQRLPIDKGIRFAISSLTTYFITVLGVMWTFYLVGIGWSKVQWLITGISVGLGFGLQEIFANFISGLILLFERPMRVGDIVSVGDHSGLVTKIQIRATTILNHDKRELVIPNKNFITGQIINWTLTDRVIRIVLQVGVAYNSDLKKVRETLLKVADSHPRVLKDPSPKALLMTFGDNSLNFELRVFIPSPDIYPEFQHDLNVAITEAFRREGINIPFPQHDVHMIPPPSASHTD